MIPLLAVLLFALGAILASFIGVVVGRWGTGESWWSGHSRCDSCGHTLAAADLVPVLSWVVLRGRCRHCGSQVSARSTITEIVLGTLFALAYWQIGLTFGLGLLLVALVILTAIVLYDLRHTIIPPLFSVSFVFAVVVYAAVVAPSAYMFGIEFITAAVIGLLLAAIHFGSRGRAMGLGDAPVAFGLGLLAGPLALSGFIYSFWVGAIVGIFILVRAPKGHRMGIEVPFAPFLAAGFLLALFSQWSLLSLMTWILTR